MTRTVSGGLTTEIQASFLRPILLVEIPFTSATINLCSLNRDVSWNAKTWLGNSWLRPIRAINETSDVRAVGVEIELVGVEQSLISLALSNLDQNLDAYIYLGALNSSGAVISDPLLIFKGKVDSVEIDDSVNEPSVIVQCESILARLQKPQNFRYTDQNQKALFAGDRGFEYAASLEDWSGYWGRTERPKPTKKRRNR